ncbi:MAG: hypothetical protein WBP60_12930 [Gammaproteobacteria bacterium]
MNYEYFRRVEVWILAVAGVAWIVTGADHSLPVLVLAAVPGSLMLIAAVGTLMFPGERGLTRSAGLGALLGLVMAIPALLTAPATGIWLALLALAGLVAAGSLRINHIAVPEDIDTPEPGIRAGAEVGLDEAVLGLISVLMPPFIPRDQPRIAGELEEALALFDARGWLDDPADYHPAPPALDDQDISSKAARSSGWDYEAMQFDSGFEPPQDAPGRDRYLSYAGCSQAHAWVMRGKVDAPWLICMHGLGMGTPVADLKIFPLDLLRRELGLNLLFPVMPLHGPRRRYTVGGRGFIAGDVMDTINAISQSIWDTRRWLDWVRRSESSIVGVFGISMGGYASALLASLDEKIQCAIPGIPATDLASLLWWHASTASIETSARSGLTLRRSARAYRVVSPLGIKPRVAKARRHIFGGAWDSFVPAAEVHKLWAHWEHCDMHWYPGAHLTARSHPRVGQFVGDAIRQDLLSVAKSDQ